MSITLCFGSAKRTQSMAGMSTPSVRHRAFVISARSCWTKRLSSSERCPADFLLEMCRLMVVGPTSVRPLSRSCCSRKRSAPRMLRWNEMACLMTATERVLRGENDDVLSMDDEAVYGERFFDLTFKDAIAQRPASLIVLNAGSNSSRD